MKLNEIRSKIFFRSLAAPQLPICEARLNFKRIGKRKTDGDTYKNGFVLEMNMTAKVELKRSFKFES